MRKVILVLAAIMVFCSMAFGFSIQPGINLGLNMGNLAYSEDLPDNVEKSSRMGITGGGVLEIGMNETVSLEGGVYYTMKGAKSKSEFMGVTAEGTTALDYLTIPIRIKAKFGPEKLRTFIALGPEIGLLMSAKYKNDEDIDIKDDLESMDLGLYFGAGLEIPMGEKFIVFNAGYTLGFMDINKDEDDDSESDMTTKNTGISFTAGVRFPL
ncbi:PorT family protein [bacterium]|nr:PorT family protein [bacterium]